ncbi:hypothetical protein BATDEDRAFT_92747 [Batrachochytrium dendrobatidis JAM81]|uniref:Uncharacterized protein n=1 Tax=Batrachochytrium dendrobatidis (strain JAM81 / FGSC 10211) TaxID=684364 RepID=F4PED0_BATDJ|nr:uncharacterized protein BATDEDRAFT_92747 [Batrachochytrium dendrobatidis JAM81]EGF76404.1 hypothetical protein BATDEDRAFT_92747 [Batrachochytrium dendrobatidis JAM81]|eukprot:XP_006683013.1 hypothetical protein BATDEDRAFT_92747 [Batrachochytrium dendrobatidis JAM81]
MSGPTDEPNPGTSNEYQEEPMYIVDPSTSRRGRKRPIDELGPNISEQDWKAIIDRPDPGIPKDWQDLVDAVNSNILKDQQQSIDQPSPSTPKRGRKRPIDEHGSNISKQDQQQSMNQPGPSASKQSRKQSTNEPGLVFPDKNWQRLIDEADSNTFEEWQELFDIAGLNTPNQNEQQPMIQSNPSTSSQDQQQYSTDTIDSSILDENWIDLFDIADSSTPNQVSGPIDQDGLNTFDQTQQHPVDAIGLSISNEDWQEIIDAANPTTSNQDQQQSMDQSNTSTSSQDQHQPTDENESDNAVSDQVTGLSEQSQRTFDGINQRLVASKVTRDKKYKEYHEYIALGLRQRLALSSEETSELGYNPKTEIRLKHDTLIKSHHHTVTDAQINVDRMAHHVFSDSDVLDKVMVKQHTLQHKLYQMVMSADVDAKHVKYIIL